MKNASTLLILAAVTVLCSACSDRTTRTATIITPTSQVASINWDEAAAATSSAKVNNTSLIFMR